METMTGDVLNINKEYENYGEYKRALDSELQRSAESFVKIGYLLKVAMDTDILKESGYSNVNEFAQAEYGLDKTQVSRFININDQFSQNGYSDQLEEHYRGFGYAKLALMLRLPEAVNRELSADYSKAEIQEIKEEVDAERSITDIEVVLEGQNPAQREMDTNMSKALHQFMYENHEQAAGLWNVVSRWNPMEDDTAVIRQIWEILAPNQVAMHSVRVQGVGRLMISIKGLEENVKLINVRNESEKEEYTWKDILYKLWGLVNTGADNAKQWWEKTYGERYPEKQKVAPVQQKPEKEKRKVSKVTKAKTEPHREEKEDENEKQRIHDEEQEKAHETDCKQEPESRQTVSDDAGQDTDSGQQNRDSEAEGEVEQTDQDIRDHEWEEAGRIWEEIQQNDNEVHVMVMQYFRMDAQHGRIPMEKLKEAYQKAISLAAGFEKLMAEYKFPEEAE